MTKPAAIDAQVVDIQNDRMHKGFIKVTLHVAAERGALLTAILGAIASTTAYTTAISEAVKEAPGSAVSAARYSIIANSILFRARC